MNDPFLAEEIGDLYSRIRRLSERVADARDEDLEQQTALAIATVMHKLGERMLTITPADVAKLYGRKVLVDKTHNGLQIKIV